MWLFPINLNIKSPLKTATMKTTLDFLSSIICCKCVMISFSHMGVQRHHQVHSAAVARGAAATVVCSVCKVELLSFRCFCLLLCGLIPTVKHRPFCIKINLTKCRIQDASTLLSFMLTLSQHSQVGKKAKTLPAN